MTISLELHNKINTLFNTVFQKIDDTPAMADKVILHDQVYVLLSLKRILNLPAEDTAKALQTFLENRWSLIAKYRLSYTLTSHTDTTVLCLLIAQELSKNAPEKSAYQYLMPTLTEVTEAYGLYEEAIENYPLEQLIITEDKKSVIPRLIIEQLSLEIGISDLRKPYVAHKKAEARLLSQEEQVALLHANSNISEMLALRASYLDLRSIGNSVGNHLQRLITELKNSGVKGPRGGTEHLATLEATEAIKVFMCFLESLPNDELISVLNCNTGHDTNNLAQLLYNLHADSCCSKYPELLALFKQNENRFTCVDVNSDGMQAILNANRHLYNLESTQENISQTLEDIEKNFTALKHGALTNLTGNKPVEDGDYPIKVLTLSRSTDEFALLMWFMDNTLIPLSGLKQASFSLNDAIRTVLNGKDQILANELLNFLLVMRDPQWNRLLLDPILLKNETNASRIVSFIVAHQLPVSHSLLRLNLICHGHQAVLAQLPQSPPDVKAYLTSGYYRGYTLLHFAVLKHQIELIKEYLCQGADPLFTPEHFVSPLTMAVQMGSKDIFLLFQEHLIDHPEISTILGELILPAIEQDRLEILFLLLDLGVGLKDANKLASQLLFPTVNTNNLSLLKQFCEKYKGANRIKVMSLALSYAVHQKNKDAVLLLLEQGAGLSELYSHQDPLCIAIENNYDDILAVLANWVDKNKSQWKDDPVNAGSAVLMLVEKRKWETIPKLLYSSINTTRHRRSGDTLTLVLNEKHYAILEQLLAYYNPHEVYEWIESAFDRAIKLNDAKALQLFMQSDQQSKRVVDYSQKLPLALDVKGTDVFQQLLQSGCSINFTLSDEPFIMYLANKKLWEHIQVLVESKNKILDENLPWAELHFMIIVFNKYDLALLISPFVKNWSYSNTTGYSDNKLTALHLAVNAREYALIEQMVDLGANPHLKDTRGSCAIDLARKNEDRIAQRILVPHLRFSQAAKHRFFELPPPEQTEATKSNDCSL